MTRMKDKYGPEYIIKVWDPKIGLEGFLVIHNTALGPGKGGIRMTPDISEEEVYRLAATMTWKNALAGIPFGGAKAGIKWSGGSAAEKKALIQSFARAIRPFLIKKYIAGPDIATGEKEMKWFAEAVGKWQVATGKPARYCLVTPSGEKCGIPHEFGSTGFGVAHSARVAAELIGLPIRGARVAIHGFGNVGTFAYKHLTAMGAKVVALADRHGVIFREQGLEPEKISKLIKNRAPVTDYPGGKKLKPEDFWKIAVDILVPASVTDVIHKGNKNFIRAKLIVEGGNIPMREDIEDELFRKGIMLVPDFVANAGGVISSYAEYKGYSREKMFELVKKKVTAATRAVIAEGLRRGLNPRAAAMALARRRVETAMKKRKNTFK
jgi:glutamate dehydrogenase (NAD(P)+)